MRDEEGEAMSNAAADALAEAADELEAKADELDNGTIPEQIIHYHATYKQMRIDARWLRARSVALRLADMKEKP